jgi:hypothetical protein
MRQWLFREEQRKMVHAGQAATIEVSSIVSRELPPVQFRELT